MKKNETMSLVDGYKLKNQSTMIKSLSGWSQKHTDKNFSTAAIKHSVVSKQEKTSSA